MPAETGVGADDLRVVGLDLVADVGYFLQETSHFSLHDSHALFLAAVLTHLDKTSGIFLEVLEFLLIRVQEWQQYIVH